MARTAARRIEVRGHQRGPFELPTLQGPFRIALFLFVALLSGRGALSAQTVPLDRGVVGTGFQLRKMDGVKRVLLVGAHPDDEDTGLIAELARGRGTTVTYMALSRGDGGQNLIGPELDEGLGILRTGELLAARALDGGQQRFGREFDFGFSKTAAETFRYWPKDDALADVVWIVRKLRPQVIISMFPPTPAAGHGQHQVAAWAAYQAFDSAADPNEFPDQLKGPDAVQPWKALKLYRSARGDPEDATIEVPTGDVDPLLGRSHFQLAMESRSQHRSQDMGVAQPIGPRNSPLLLVKSRVGMGAKAIFAGVDTALADQADGLPPDRKTKVQASIRRYRTLVHRAEANLDALHISGDAPTLTGAIQALQEAEKEAGTGAGTDELRRALDAKLDDARNALLSSAEVLVDVRTNDDMVVPGEELQVDVSVWNGGPVPVERARPQLVLPSGWSAEPVAASKAAASSRSRGFFGRSQVTYRDGVADVAPGSAARWRFRVKVPKDAALSKNYYLERPRKGQMYQWPADRSLWGLPRNPPVVQAKVGLTVAPKSGMAGAEQAAGTGDPSVRVQVERAAEYVGVDKARGQYRSPVLVVPAISVLTSPRIMAWPVAEHRARTVTVDLSNQARAGFHGTLSLEAPDGWNVDPSSVDVSFDEPGQERSVAFQVRPPAGVQAGRHDIRAVAVSRDGQRFAQGFQVIDYPHIRKNVLFHDAKTTISMFPVKVDSTLRVGYIMGSGDDGAKALRQIGMKVDLLGPDQVRQGEFSPYDVIVLGVRAYEVRPDLVDSNDQLLDWVRAGGTLIVQYNKYEFSGSGLAPYPVTIHRPHDRVTYEDAPVTILDPTAPVFNEPNKITAADWKGWAQERGLYFLHTWDPHYTPLLSMHDPGEQPKKGSLLVTSLGKGVWVYAALAFFRQWPEGVPGGYRLFANLVSLRAKDWDAHMRARQH